MKKLILVVLIVPFLISCNHQKIKKLESQNDSLLQQASLKDESINEFLMSFNEIQDNLDSIKTKEMIITESTAGKTELKKNAKDQINDDINTIYLLLNDTQDKLEELRKKLGKSNYQVQELTKWSINSIQAIGKWKKMKRSRLWRGELEQMNIKVSDLTRNVTNLKKVNKNKMK
ncbi:MAG: hypothetical protein R2764_26115 [Bacteroidales bacterium]